MSRRAAAQDAPATDDAAQRIDKWLWCARLVKTRALGQALAEKGKIRLTRNGAVQRIEKAHFVVRPGDRLSFMIGGRLRVLDVLRCADRRGSASGAGFLYSDAPQTRLE
ncbi:MAG: RNA-binding S4 domain-containing protein [Parvularculaceae bacterium]|nr:RNA-binding S4 domain-containing protein [Parvularculaceae bacterium]